MHLTLDSVKSLRLAGDLVDRTCLLLALLFLCVESLSKPLFEQLHMVVLWLEKDKISWLVEYLPLGSVGLLI